MAESVSGMLQELEGELAANCVERRNEAMEKQEKLLDVIEKIEEKKSTDGEGECLGA